jgi:tetratricopeptide (TPR) repeat protein
MPDRGPPPCRQARTLTTPVPFREGQHLNCSKTPPCPVRWRVEAGLVGAVVLVGSALAGCGGGSSGGKAADANTLLAAGIKLQQQGNSNAARQMFEQVLAKQPSNFYAHYNLGVLDQQAKDNPSALREYGDALTINPNYVPALFNEATIFALSDAALAITTYRRVIALQAHAPTAYLNLGLLEYAHGEQAQGIRDLNTALHQDPSLGPQVPAALLKKVGAYANSASASASASPSPTHT